MYIFLLFTYIYQIAKIVHLGNVSLGPCQQLYVSGMGGVPLENWRHPHTTSGPQVVSSEAGSLKMYHEKLMLTLSPGHLRKSYKMIFHKMHVKQ